MCGIAGWFADSPVTEDEQSGLQAMTTQLSHRGPNGSGTKIHSHAALGHTRLSIIDLQDGQQPMASHDHEVTISFNGEIYNYRKLRQNLLQQEYPFQTHSDTEVIIALYQRYGIDGFRQLRGMYAFALWDNKKKSGILCRDALGIKPLFMQTDPKLKQLIFASEAKAILAKTNTASLNTQSLHLLLNFRYIPNSQSLFNNIVQLKPGEIIVWQPQRPIHSSQLSSDVETHYNSTLEAFQDSVAAHFTADVEVGCYLSGGIDSAAICAYGKPLAPNRLQTFTLNAGDDPMEAKNAQRSAQILGIQNHCQSIDTDISKDLHHLVWHLEVPKVNALQVSMLARLASAHVKVCLSGLGGDELFYGYNIHRYMHWAQRLKIFLPGLLHRLPGLAGSRIIRSLASSPNSETERQFMALHQLGNWSHVYALLRNVWDSPELRTRIYGPRMLDSKLDNCFETLQQQWPADQDPVKSTALFEFRNKMVNDLLWQEDRMSMAHGLEVRVPFIDYYFANRVQQLSRQQLMPGGRIKEYMRNQFKTLLGDEIIQRRKSGFQVDAVEFFWQHLKPLANYYLAENKVNEYGLFNFSFIKTITKLKPRKKLRWHYFILYLMILTHIWVELFENKKSFDDCF